ncbi:MAG: hypothetical protein N4A74_06950 [Carboxylicivirga sp.]|nr:hypothetical protein [Carboxylicivirga sp.]
MHLIRLQHIFLGIILWAFGLTVDAQRKHLQLRYNEEIHIISNYVPVDADNSEKQPIDRLLRNGVAGFIFQLELNATKDTILLVTPSDKRIPFANAEKTIKDFLEKDSLRVLSLFLDYDFNPSRLLKAFKKSGLNNYLFDKKYTGEWPTFQSLISENKRLLCFSYNQQHALNPQIKYLWDYAVDPIKVLEAEKEANPKGMGQKGNQLLYLNSHQVANIVNPDEYIKRWADLNQSPQVLAHTIDVWKTTGKKPNFFICNQYKDIYAWMRGHINNHLNVTGIVSYNRKPLENVFWEGDNYSMTYGRYCFPATPNEDLMLKPQKQGFRFIPEDVRIKNITEDKINNFIAVPVEIGENLVAHLPFDDKIEDKSMFHHKLKNNNVKIIADAQRGLVGEFDGESYLTMPKADDLGISNSDFTVSAWINLARVNASDKRDFTILGTAKIHYRGGLHLQVRFDKPYFGFFSNDLQGVSALDVNRWYHVVWRYTKYNQEQAIYVNGVADCASLNHPPFVSDGNIFIGKSLKERNEFEGKIDDLIIWNRALGDEEIWNLYQDRYYEENTSLASMVVRYKYWLIGFLVLLIIALLLILRKRLVLKKPAVTKPEMPLIELNSDRQTKNVISLFGDFQVIDSNGDDITERFTPRIKQIFIYLLILSKEKSHGVSSEEFLNTIWPSFERKKAINNRGVTVSKLRGVLELLDSVKISNAHDRWKVDLSDAVYCDYYEALELSGSDLFAQREQLNNFLSVIQGGAFLQDSTDECFDNVKGIFSNRIIDILTRLLSDFDASQNPEMVIQIADRILLADDLNQEACQYKLKALVAMHQINQARFVYKSFSEKYKKIYNEEFSMSFDELIR